MTSTFAEISIASEPISKGAMAKEPTGKGFLLQAEFFPPFSILFELFNEGNGLIPRFWSELWEHEGAVVGHSNRVSNRQATCGNSFLETVSPNGVSPHLKKIACGV